MTLLTTPTTTTTKKAAPRKRTGDLPAVLGGDPVFGERLPLVRPALGDTSALERRYADILGSGMLTNGPTVRELEETVAARLGVAHVVAVASCTSGLMLVLQAIGATRHVVLPSLTFSASAHAVMWAGGTPAFAEVSEDSLTLDPTDAERVVSELGDDVSAMTATHVYGTPCRTQALQQVADRAGIPLVYDAAHGLGSMRAGTPVGNFGVAEVFSLSPTKVVVAGEGGLIATHDADLARQLRLGRDYGNPGDYDTRFAGLNARMSELHAATALHSLSLLDQALVRRREMVRLFWAELGEVAGVRGPILDEGDVSTYKDLTVVVDEATAGVSAAEVGRALAAEGVDSRHYYDPPIHRQQAYRHLPARSLPLTDRLAGSVVSPALWSHMDDDQVRGIARAFRRILHHAPAVHEQEIA
ncbi:DegT/DnrJ/EryC1/StrS family aminotransferase [Nocardioides euryhalodurans]|uniref:DegT/DnrJ/EryC1/StrS family aminotransferase n=1 Tax=Nocardioides euryhalodurans TaxID=2518370 RepID=A0A4P7GHN4_9ACTN|nr:DegT/DnrJ/EryC1/StrS family aminotransferase [Nocardioides euryhalodurans]QBR91197.1 DegT/DnrJ/EryC1/StrS family aminotransferase [Nocardioides euryhalodurans]